MTAFRVCQTVGIIALTLAGPSQVARSQQSTKHIAAASGQAVFVENESQWNENCQWKGNPTYDFQNPKHGSISTRDEQKVIKSCAAGACGCMGRTVPGSAVYYTSEPGFHGKDAFSYTSRFNNGKVLAHSVSIDVK
jgi:hypothetical protein